MQALIALAFVALFGNLEAISLTDSNVQDGLIHRIIGNHVSTDLNPLVDMDDAKLSVPELIEKYGYPVEIHKILTEDNYTLEAHRIPYGKKCGAAEGKEVIWLQHGLLGDSSNWVLTGVDKGLAYLLADACYDVWMGNARGNTYSKKHQWLSPITDEDKPDFWAFSWHEMGIYDLPAVIDYTLSETKAAQLSYVGHSMGTTMFWVCMSERPEYNAKIKLMSALAPVAFMTNMKSPVAALAPIANNIEALLVSVGAYEFLPATDFLEQLGAKLCDPVNPYHPICSSIIFVLCGTNMDQMDKELLPVLVGHSPAGASTRSVIHYAQGVNVTHFRQYDFGRDVNMEKYGQELPPDYDLSKITAPVALYWGDNDYLANLTDVQLLSTKLPNVKLNYRMKHDKFNHLDFVFAIDVKTLVNDPLMYFLETGEEPTTTATTEDPASTKPSSEDNSGVSPLGMNCNLFLILALSIYLVF